MSYITTAEEQAQIRDEQLARQLQAEEDEQAARMMQTDEGEAIRDVKLLPSGKDRSSTEKSKLAAEYSDRKDGHIAIGDTEKKSGPPDYLPPFGHPPSTSSYQFVGSSTGTTTNHTNPLIEASKLRAKTEVSLFYWESG
jgi:hypothetical protein